MFHVCGQNEVIPCSVMDHPTRFRASADRKQASEITVTSYHFRVAGVAFRATATAAARPRRNQPPRPLQSGWPSAEESEGRSRGDAGAIDWARWLNSPSNPRRRTRPPLFGAESQAEGCQGKRPCPWCLCFRTFPALFCKLVKKHYFCNFITLHLLNIARTILWQL